jgi:hypothetical protein
MRLEFIKIPLNRRIADSAHQITESGPKRESELKSFASLESKNFFESESERRVCASLSVWIKIIMK